jgi:hypothetical protein
MQKRIMEALKKVILSEIVHFPFAEEGDIIKIGDAFWRVIGEQPNNKNYLVAYRSDRKGNVFQKKLLLWFMDTEKEKNKRLRPNYKFKKIGNIPPTAKEIPLWEEWRKRRS